MGFLQDIHNLQKQAEAMTPSGHRGSTAAAKRDGVRRPTRCSAHAA